MAILFPHTPSVRVPSCCTKALGRGVAELSVLFKKLGSDTVLLLVRLPSTVGNVTVLGLDRSLQNLVEGGK